jgi:hypothetical protein
MLTRNVSTGMSSQERGVHKNPDHTMNDISGELCASARNWLQIGCSVAWQPPRADGGKSVVSTCVVGHRRRPLPQRASGAPLRGVGAGLILGGFRSAGAAPVPCVRRHIRAGRGHT